jgi:hypothetical protein
MGVLAWAASPAFCTPGHASSCAFDAQLEPATLVKNLSQLLCSCILAIHWRYTARGDQILSCDISYIERSCSLREISEAFHFYRVYNSTDEMHFQN